MKKFLLFPLLFIALLIFSPTSSAAISFEEKLDQAMSAGLRGDFGSSGRLFQKLLQSNPDQFIVYDFYAQTLEFRARFYDKPKAAKRNYAAAAALYQRWLERGIASNPLHGELAAQRIKSLEFKEGFTDLLEGFSDWEKAKSYPAGRFSVRSNLPEDYVEEIITFVNELWYRQGSLLEDMFGAPEFTESGVKILITGRWEDFRKANHEISPRALPASTVTYFSQERTIVLLFDGDMDAKALARSLASYLFLTRYDENPSKVMLAGISEYLAYKTAKSYLQAEFLNRKEFLDFLYSVGHWNNFYDFSSRNEEEFSLRAWMFVLFFAQVEMDADENLLRKYWLAEKKGVAKAPKEFFKKNVPSGRLEELNNAWLDFTLNLDYPDL